MPKKKDIELEWDMEDLLDGLDKYDAWMEEKFDKVAQLVAMDGLGRMVEACAVATGYLRGSSSVHVNNKFVAVGKDLIKTRRGRPKRGNMRLNTAKELKEQAVIVWGFNASYAAKRHENPKPAPKGGGGKFIESVLKERAKKWLEFFADSLKQT